MKGTQVPEMSDDPTLRAAWHKIRHGARKIKKVQDPNTAG